MISAFDVYLFKYFNIFKRHGIIHIPVISLLGLTIKIIFHRISFVHFTQKIYNYNPDAKYFRFYTLATPVFLLRDPELRSVRCEKFCNIFRSFWFRYKGTLTYEQPVCSSRTKVARRARSIKFFFHIQQDENDVYFDVETCYEFC